MQVSAGEEAVTVGSAAALGPNDIICTQYREHGVFQQRGFTLKDFMSQLFATHNDPGKGRNMPNHYSGRTKVGVVSRMTPNAHPSFDSPVSSTPLPQLWEHKSRMR
jgi:TPP-dependent pyruvate/acetoin dehydrogenase alpha subunit